MHISRLGYVSRISRRNPYENPKENSQSVHVSRESRIRGEIYCEIGSKCQVRRDNKRISNSVCLRIRRRFTHTTRPHEASVRWKPRWEWAKRRVRASPAASKGAPLAPSPAAVKLRSAHASSPTQTSGVCSCGSRPRLPSAWRCGSDILYLRASLDGAARTPQGRPTW